MALVRMIETASHTAHIHMVEGTGFLVRPNPADDVVAGEGWSLQASDWDSMMDHLSAIGWEPAEDEEGELVNLPPIGEREVVLLVESIH